MFLNVTQISQITQIYFQSPAERKEIKEMFLNVTRISQITQIYFRRDARNEKK